MAQSKNGPHPIDRYAGRKLREARTMRGMSQQTLGKLLDHAITFQQVQKYERGQNRIAVSRLYEFATVLQLPTTYFLPGQEVQFKPMLTAQESDLLECFHAMNPKSKTSLITLLKGIMRVS
jgi:transcriptional regulator with XRE-family HTH domain